MFGVYSSAVVQRTKLCHHVMFSVCVYVYAHASKHMHDYIYSHVHGCMCVGVCRYIYTCIHICIHANVWLEGSCAACLDIPMLFLASSFIQYILPRVKLISQVHDCRMFLAWLRCRIAPNPETTYHPSAPRKGGKRNRRQNS